MMLTPKFIKLVKKDGFMRTWQRGHKAIRNTQLLGGHADAVKCVGQDQFGNRYYEDFDVDRESSVTQTIITEDGSSMLTISSLWDSEPIEFLLGGVGGSPTLTTIFRPT